MSIAVVLARISNTINTNICCCQQDKQQPLLLVFVFAFVVVVVVLISITFANTMMLVSPTLLRFPGWLFAYFLYFFLLFF